MEYYQQFIGNTEKVLVEKPINGNWYFGYGEHYIPIIFQHFQNLKNQWVDVKLTRIIGGKRILMEGESVLPSVLNQQTIKITDEPKLHHIGY